MNDVITKNSSRRAFRVGDLVDVKDRAGEIHATLAVSTVAVRGVATSDGQWWTHGGWFLTDEACHTFPWIQHHK